MMSGAAHTDPKPARVFTPAEKAAHDAARQRWANPAERERLLANLRAKRSVAPLLDTPDHSNKLSSTRPLSRSTEHEGAGYQKGEG